MSPSSLVDFIDDSPSSTPDPQSTTQRVRPRAVASHIRPGAKVHPLSAYINSPDYSRAITAKPESQVLKSFLAEDLEEEEDGEGYFVSYVLEEFVIYRTPDIKPLEEENAEGEKMTMKVQERGQKGQGEFDLPSAVYITFGLKNLMFDGVLRSGDKKEVLHGVPFDVLSLGNLATPTEHNLQNQIWIQSHLGAKAPVSGGVWYELVTPAKDYTKHWEAFSWLALFVKYVSDALELCVQRQQKVTLNYFKKDFAAEMRKHHLGDPTFKTWISAYGKDDFRVAMATNVEFLWAQLQTAHSESHPLTEHLEQPVWGEILPTDLTAIIPAHAPHAARSRCVVTAYVASLFSWIFGEGVEVIEPDSPDELLYDEEFDHEPDLDIVLATKIRQAPKYYDFHHDEMQRAVVPRFTTGTTGEVKVGDVVEMRRDDATRWKKSTQNWYAYVTDRWNTPKEVGKMKILWLYWPEDVALCMNMKYPFENELFFSDHCECGQLILEEEVVRKVAVEFFCLDGKPKDPNAEFFVRQKYFSVEHDIHVITLTPQDLSPETPCPCHPPTDLPTFSPGDFVLVKERDRLQPYRLEMCEDSRTWVRRMERRREIDGEGKVNELVWTEVVVDVAVRRVVRKCRVVKVKMGEEIPRLADWGGSSDWWFYREGVKVEDLRPVEVEAIPKMEVDSKDGSQLPVLDEGAAVSDSVTITTEPDSSLPSASVPRTDPNNATPASAIEDSIPFIDGTPSIASELHEETPTPAIKDETEPVRSCPDDSLPREIPDDRKLRALDLFCGGGNFGRGVADGGAVHHKWAVDIDINAIHSYKANLEHEGVNLYFGSINNFLFDIITGRRRHLPTKGDVDFILAGSPCQGFSIANTRGHDNQKSLSNSALVCTTISAIDFYRPKYALLENVPAMASSRKYLNGNAIISNQIMCALIGMGYQCRCLFLDAWNFGAPQLRTRLFIEIAAPGCVLPEIPPGSHAHPPGMKKRAIGKTATNIKFAERDVDTLTSFPSVQVGEVWKDLPSIGNGHLGVCIPYPDHKTYWTANARDRHLAAHIPHSDSLVSAKDSRFPGYRWALRRNLIPKHLQPRVIPNNEADGRFIRIAADGLVPTVTTGQNPLDRNVGKTLHYNEDRVISNLEAKRAQGFLDTDVLVGKAVKAYRIIGNSVCRQVAFALGESLAEAVRKTPKVEKSKERELVGQVLRERIDLGVTTTRSPSQPRKFMVLITKKGVKRDFMGFNGDCNNRDPSDEDDVRVDLAVNGAVQNLEVSFTSSQRKKIRIAVDEEFEDAL